jgi:hypothetical protein
LYEPAAHAVHTSPVVAPTAVLNVPGAHDAQVPLRSATLKEPAAHATQTVGEAPPESALEVPWAHETHALADEAPRSSL